MAYFLVGLIVLLLGAQWGLRSFFDRHIRAVARVSVGIILFALALQTFNQFQAWEGEGLTRFLLPPYQSPLYFWGYVLGRMWAPYIIAGLLGVLIGYGMRWYNRAHDNRFFEPEEMVIAPLAFFLAGWPGAIIYAVVFVGVFTVASVIMSVIVPRHARLSTYYFWLPVALFAILIGEYVVRGTTVWNILTI